MPKKSKNTDIAQSDAETDTIFLSSEHMISLVEKITANFTVAFNSCVEKMTDAMEKRIVQRIEVQACELFELHKKIDVLERNCKHLEAANNQLAEKIINCLPKLNHLSSTLTNWSNI